MPQVYDRRDGSLLGSFVRRDTSMREGEIVVYTPADPELIAELRIFRDDHTQFVGASDAIILSDALADRVSELTYTAEFRSVDDYNAGLGGYGYWGPIIGHDDMERAVLLCGALFEQDEDGCDLYSGWVVLDHS